jgi:glycosyltransferase involved in cell wall biosynthesis
MVLIPNGFQTDLYRPDEHIRYAIRSALGIAAGSVVIGIVGRFDPQKDHQLFVQAAAKVANEVRDVRFLFCGDGLSRDNVKLLGWIRAGEIEDRCLLLGRRDDLHELYCAMDVMVSSSAYGEGFPNVIGEAMSCGVPCVVTDVGDSALIVGDTGRVVPPRDLDALAKAIREIAVSSFEERIAIGAAARRRILEHYDLPSVASRYMTLYKDVIAQCAA